MDNNRNEALLNIGIPYDNIIWNDIEGQPFGIASNFNAIIFEDANNIIDTKGAMAVGGNFYSPRGLSLAFGENVKLAEVNYSPDAVRFLVGGNITTGGPLVVIGHVVAGGRFRGASGSTYFIGKDQMATQLQELEFLYQAVGGSPYWTPTDKRTHYIISSYDVPRYIPASRIGADVGLFFEEARDSITDYKNCIMAMEENGTVIDNFHEWILSGNDPELNVFVIDARPNGILNKGIRAEVPDGSLIVVRFRTGNNAHIQYGLWGDRRHVHQTLYVFEDANEIFMEVPAAIWGSILAPQAMFHAHPTGGHISGNAAFRSFAVSATSGFEFHSHPFMGGLYCGVTVPTMPEEAEEMPVVETPPITEYVPYQPFAPTQEFLPAEEMPVIPAPEQAPCPECPPQQPCPTCPTPPPCPACPTPEPCPTPPPCPAPLPCPDCPAPEPCPDCPPPEPCPTCPTPEPCPDCPDCPDCPLPEPCPTCPTPEPCPVCPDCPDCPEARSYTEFVPLPIPIPYPEPTECPECPISLITPGIISGYVRGCNCCRNHPWEITLYQICKDEKIMLYCERIACFGSFEYEVPYEGNYMLSICPPRNYRRTAKCKPIIVLENVGVSNFMIC
ncbi:choice-of-anchor A domain-containing protein [Mobilisporobacter senegalensis]|uniref:Choice-of-anchor A domain-containing protein n=1 Tax=Mobilisporobacter senegalensis TaxID=1329262 RepID=A0A3N1XPW7_9FIRM|nr:choice-of-anchor A family protein [Mobilisporobacter senegalensis]ROR28656.1 choice-of-anchor A domain-containing protein [Mobilisporobacter senegalensis]